GITDVGRFKVEALRDRILDVNPAAEIDVYPEVLENSPAAVRQDYYGLKSLILCCADNREGDLNANPLSCLTHTPSLWVGLGGRAFAGGVFWPSPPKPPFSHSVFGSAPAALWGRVPANRHVYTDQEDVVGVAFEPGISIDIGFVTNVGIKIALDIL